jgi:ATP-dependent DNA helicase RecG
MNTELDFYSLIENIARVVDFVKRSGREDVLEANRNRLTEWLKKAISVCREKNLKSDLAELMSMIDSESIETIARDTSEILQTVKKLKGGKLGKKVKDKSSTKTKKNETHNLDGDVRFIKGVGEFRANALSRLGVETVYDLFMLFPRDYEDRREITRVEDIIPGEEYTVLARILEVSVDKFRGGKERLRVIATDGTQRFQINWWGMTYLQEKLGRGEMLRIYGKADVYDKVLQFNNPEFDTGEDFDRINYGRIVPVYPLTEGLNQKGLRRIIYNALEKYRGSLRTIIPPSTATKDLYPISTAVEGVHFPENYEMIEDYKKRLSLESIFIIHMAIGLRRRRYTDLEGIQIEPQGILKERFLGILPFSLTRAQKKVTEQIENDLKSIRPMHRLLQGDVGSGKTVVAVLSALNVIEEGYQAVIMAPTEILARQHYQRLKDMFSRLGLRMGLLVGGQESDERRETLTGLKNGEIDMVAGTHALIEEKVEFNNLGLVVIDEQHKFGVHQRTRLVEKGKGINLLVMTATPIPRTIALTIYGDLDLSIIDELPHSTKNIDTIVMDENERGDLFDIIEKYLEEGEQGFIVYPLIDESDKLDVRAITEGYEYLSSERFKDYRVEMVHGRLMKEEQKNIIERFESGEIQLLLTTTVAEVGIDIRGASFIVVKNAERFGLSQLHQLRGRVGRAGQKAYCYLILGENATELAKERMSILENSIDGFYIAEEDLRLRGPGEFAGVRQSGVPDYVLQSMVRYPDLIEKAKTIVDGVLNEDPQLKDEKYRQLRDRIKEKHSGIVGITFSG